MEPVEEPAIRRECFEKSCMLGECHVSKMPCAAHSAASPSQYSIFLDDTDKEHLVAQSSPATPGLVGITVHKAPVDPNLPTTMPGVPAVAPPKFLKQMQKQDALLQKIVKMEKTMATQDPKHQKSRSNWLQLAQNVKEMPAGPDKLKSENLLLKLAQEMSQKEKSELQDDQQKAKNPPTQPQAAPATAPAQGGGAAAALAGKRALVKRMLVTKMTKAAHEKMDEDKKNPSAEAKDIAAAQMVPQYADHILDKLMPDSASSKDDGKTVHGLPMGHRQCYERACMTRAKDGSCAAMVIACGDQNGNAPKVERRHKVGKEQAIKELKKSMGPMGAALAKGLSPKTKAVVYLEQLSEAMHNADNAQSSLPY